MDSAAPTPPGETAQTAADGGATRPGLGELLRDTYLRIDTRSLALGRIAIGLVLIADLLRRIPWIRHFYSNAGLIPNHTVLWRPPFPRIFSVFFMASLPEESSLLFWVCFFCFFCFLIGYRTKLFHLLSFALTTSLHNRIIFAENWGGVAMGVLIVWTAFLPLGRRFSVDALLASLRARPHETTDDLAAGVPPPDTRPVVSPSGRPPPNASITPSTCPNSIPRKSPLALAIARRITRLATARGNFLSQSTRNSLAEEVVQILVGQAIKRAGVSCRCARFMSPAGSPRETS